MTSTLVSACWKGSSTTGLCLLKQHAKTTSHVGSTERFPFCPRYGPALKRNQPSVILLFDMQLEGDAFSEPPTLVCSRISRRTIAPDKASTRTYSEVIMMRTHQLLNKISSKEADRQSMYISRSQTTLKASRVVVPNIRQILTAGLQLITVTTSTIKVPVRMVSPQNRLPCR